MAIGTPTTLLSALATDTSNTTTCVATTSVAGTAGSLIYALCWHRNASSLTATVSGGGLTWTTRDFNNAGGAGGCSIGYAQDPGGLASSTALTCTWSASGTRKGMQVYKVTGLDTSASVEDTPFRAAGTPGATGNATVTAAATSAQADELFVVITRHNAATGTVTGTPVGTGFVESDDAIVGASTFLHCWGGYKIASATEQPTTGTTFSDTTTNWHCGVMAFKAAAAATVTPQRNQRFLGSRPVQVRATGPQIGWR